MRFFRSERVSKLIREHLGALLAREVEFPEGTLATITGVEVDRKLEHAKVEVSVIPSARATAVLAVLDRRAGELQYRLTKIINIKPMPHISFALDCGYEHAAAVEKRILENGAEGDAEQKKGPRDESR